MKLSIALLLLLVTATPPANAFIEPEESTFGASLVSSLNTFSIDTSTAFYFGHEIDESSNLFHPSNAVFDAKSVTIDARSGNIANVDLSIPLLPGHGNHLSWQGFTDSNSSKQPVTNAEWTTVSTAALQNWISSHQKELNIDASELFPSMDNLSATDNGNSEGTVRSAVHNNGDLIQFSIQRIFKGLVVRDSRASATIKAGNLINLGFELWKDLEDEFDVIPGITAKDAYEVLARSTGYQLKKGRTCKPELQILTQAAAEDLFIPSSGRLRANNSSFQQQNVTSGYTTSLVWKVCPTFVGQTIEMFEGLVDAKTLTVYSFRDTVEYYQVRGDVYPLSNDGKDANGQLQLDWPMPFAQVGNEVTDTGGNYWNGAYANAYLYGPYVNMVDYCGREVVSGSNGIDWGGYAASGDCGTPGYGGAGNTHASRSGFYELNKIMEIARSHLPSNTWLQQQLIAVMNVNNNCNAYWNGRNIYFYRSGNGCGNTGELAGVVDHEWGHGMDAMDVASGISKPSGEGIADVYAALRLNDSCIGRGFYRKLCEGNGNACLSCTGVRDIDYMKRKNQSPSTYSWANKNCNGVHCLGAVYSEAIWSLYKRHLQGSPYNYDENTALEITTRLTYIGAGNVQTWFEGSAGSGGCGTSSGYRQFLLADDDNGNINDGTPHMTAIYNAFNDQEIACNNPTVKDSGCAGNPNQAPIVTVIPGNMRAVLSWNGVSGASNYEVFRTEGVNGCSQGKVKLATLSSNDRSFTDTGLQNGREYYYIVIPKGPNAACFGPASQCTTVTPSESVPVTPSPTQKPTPNPTPKPTPNPTSSSPCGNGICELLKNETPLTCSKDCILQDLTLSSGTNNNKAMTFETTSSKDVSFASIGIVGQKTGTSLVRVYTRAGSYNGFENSSIGWELCFNQSIQLQIGVPTFVDISSCSTHTRGGTIRSFHVYSKNGMYIQKGTMNSSGNTVQVNNSVMLKDLFKQVQGAGIMAGSLRFYEASAN